MKWQIIDTGRNSAEKNMAIDRELLLSLSLAKRPILHFYEWETPSATYGYFLNPYKYLCKEGIEKHGITLARRPTGGGVVFHLNDFAFSVLIPATHPNYSVNTLDNYAHIHRILAQAVGQFLGGSETIELLPQEPLLDHADAKHFCMAGPTVNDVMYGGKKIAGGAQRRTRHGFLHQGTLSLGSLQVGVLEDVLLDQHLKSHFIEYGMRQQIETKFFGKSSLRIKERLRQLITECLIGSDNL